MEVSRAITRCAESVFLWNRSQKSSALRLILLKKSRLRVVKKNKILNQKADILLLFLIFSKFLLSIISKKTNLKIKLSKIFCFSLFFKMLIIELILNYNFKCPEARLDFRFPSFYNLEYKYYCMPEFSYDSIQKLLLAL